MNAISSPARPAGVATCRSAMAARSTRSSRIFDDTGYGPDRTVRRNRRGARALPAGTSFAMGDLSARHPRTSSMRLMGLHRARLDAFLNLHWRGKPLVGHHIIVRLITTLARRPASPSPANSPKRELPKNEVRRVPPLLRQSPSNQMTGLVRRVLPVNEPAPRHASRPGFGGPADPVKLSAA